MPLLAGRPGTVRRARVLLRPLRRPDGTICCLYEKGQEQGVSYYSGDIAFARFDLEWLTNGQDRP